MACQFYEGSGDTLTGGCLQQDAEKGICSLSKENPGLKPIHFVLFVGLKPRASTEKQPQRLF